MSSHRAGLLPRERTGSRRWPPTSTTPGDGTFAAYRLMVLALRDGRIAGITGFAEVGEVFPRLGRPDRPGD